MNSKFHFYFNTLNLHLDSPLTLVTYCFYCLIFDPIFLKPQPGISPNHPTHATAHPSLTWQEALTWHGDDGSDRVNDWKDRIHNYPYGSQWPPSWQIDISQPLPRLSHPDLPGKTWCLDFTAAPYRRLLTDWQHQQPLLKALRYHQSSEPIYDLTAGWLRDSLLICAAGYRVKAYERHPLIAFLCQQALEHARQHPTWGETYRQIELSYAWQDSCDWLQQAPQAEACTFYVDIMFDSYGRAAVKKPSAWLRAIIGDQDQDSDLLTQALQKRQSHQRVIYKTAPHTKVTPTADYVIDAKASRLHIYAAHGTDTS